MFDVEGVLERSVICVYIGANEYRKLKCEAAINVMKKYINLNMHFETLMMTAGKWEALNEIQMFILNVFNLDCRQDMQCECTSGYSWYQVKCEINSSWHSSIKVNFGYLHTVPPEVVSESGHIIT